MGDKQILYEDISCELILTTKCNLSCSYCIAHGLEEMTMHIDRGKDAIDMFISLGEGAKSVEFVFTGGEPLLNFMNLKVLTAYAEERAKLHSMVPLFVIKTNGMLFDDAIIDFCINYGVKIIISIDGLSEFHDKNRITLDGKPSQASVVNTIIKLKKKKIRLSASLTCHPNYAKNIFENIKYLHSLGVNEIDIGPVYGTATWSRAQIKEFKNSLVCCADYSRQANEYEVFEISPINRHSEHINDILKNNWGCKAGASNLAFMPNGYITGCSALAMLTNKYTDLIIGDIDSGINEQALERLFDSSQAAGDERLSCIKCKSNNNCAGGCIAINLSTTQSPLIPPKFYCEIISSIPATWEKAWGKMKYKHSPTKQYSQSLRSG